MLLNSFLIIVNFKKWRQDNWLCLEHESLYIFGNKVSKGHIQKASCNVLSSVANSINHEIMVWHFRLGHPSFPYLKKLLSSLFRNKNLRVISLWVLQVSKHCWNSYVSQPYKKSHHFCSYIVIYGDHPILAT